MSADEEVEFTHEHGKELTVTYRSLRLALVLAVLMLAVSVITETVRAGELRGSLSSYFYSPTRSIFVGVLLVIGFSLIAIHVVQLWEEFWLTLGGMFAIIVALVPTGPPSCTLGAVTSEATPAGGLVPAPLVRDIADRSILECFPHVPGDGLPGWVVAGVWNNVLALIVVGLIAVFIALRYTNWSAGTSSALMWSLIVYAVSLVAGGLLFWLWDDFRDRTHGVAAILTFVCFGAVALINGWLRPGENTGKFLWTYRSVTIGMIVAFVVFLAVRLAGGFRTDVFWLEAVEITLFAIFWLAQTIQHWHEADL